jgi:4-nitrophenyl phosphatase
MDRFPKIRGMIIDMDGVLWRGKEPLSGMPELFSMMRRMTLPFVLATNNASASPASVQAKLAAMGVEISREEVLGSAEATVAWLSQRQAPGTSVYVIGEDALCDALAQAGFKLPTRSDGVRSVVVGIDREINWSKMTEAVLAIRAGALFVGTNPDPSFPFKRGLAPGNGAILAALQAASGVKPVIIGKPESPLFEQAMQRIGTAPEETLVLGDRLETDILGGKQAGLRTGLVLTGVTSQDDLADSPVQPDWVFDDLPDFLNVFAEASR